MPCIHVASSFSAAARVVTIGPTVIWISSSNLKVISRRALARCRSIPCSHVEIGQWTSSFTRLTKCADNVSREILWSRRPNARGRFSMSDADHPQAWIEKAESDFLCIENNLAAKRVPWDVVAFHAQQAAEKML